MSNENKLIPELRFPEFKNEGEWIETVIGSVVEMKGRIGYRGYTTEDIVDKGKGAITLSPSNFDANGQLNFGKCTYISWSKYEESPEIQLEEGQTVLVKTASVGKTAYVDKLPEKATVNPQIVVLKPKDIQNKFLAYTIAHQNTQNQIRNSVGAGAIPNISQEIISKIKIILPPDIKKREQQKIASCLFSLDEVIATHSQKLELLKDHKKGLMQNLFPQEEETVPKYRFPEFVNDGEWEEKTIGEFAPLQRGFDLPADNITAGDYPVVFSNGILKYHNEYKVTAPGIVTGRSGTIGKVTYVNEDFWPHNTSLWVTDFCGNYPLFVFYYFVLIGLEQFGTGSGVPTLNRNDVHRQNILIPLNIKEQQKISECLSSLDALIIAQTENIEQLKLYKKGLMQGLFPKTND